MSEESYIPSQTPESEEVTTDYESSSLETPSDSKAGSSLSEYSIACSEECSGSSDRSSSYFDSVSDSQTSIMTVSVSESESSTLSQSSTLSISESDAESSILSD